MSNLVEIIIVENATKDPSRQRTKIARNILLEMDAKKQGKANVADDIYKATVKAFFRNKSRNNAESEKAEENGEDFKPAIYDIAFTSFIQSVCNSLAWKIRKTTLARERADQAETEGLDNGMDYCMDLCSEYGLDGSSKESILADYVDLFSALNAVYSMIASKLIQPESLYMFAPQEIDPVTNEWNTICKVNSIDEVFAELEKQAEILKEQNAVSDCDIVAVGNIDFTAHGEDHSALLAQLTQRDADFQKTLPGKRKAEAARVSA